jgi:hypothetical protein
MCVVVWLIHRCCQTSNPAIDSRTAPEAVCARYRAERAFTSLWACVHHARGPALHCPGTRGAGPRPLLVQAGQAAARIRPVDSRIERISFLFPFWFQFIFKF